MGTKTFPGMFDCDSKQLPDEPGFKLLARDPVAPHLVELWAAIRSGDAILAITLSAKAIEAQAEHYANNPTNSEQIDEALRCAASMRAYRSK